MSMGLNQLTADHFTPGSSGHCFNLCRCRYQQRWRHLKAGHVSCDYLQALHSTLQTSCRSSRILWRRPLFSLQRHQWDGSVVQLSTVVNCSRCFRHQSLSGSCFHRWEPGWPQIWTQRLAGHVLLFPTASHRCARQMNQSKRRRVI